MHGKVKSSISRLTVSSMNDAQRAIVNNLKTLISVKGGSHFIKSFTTNEVSDLVSELSVRQCNVSVMYSQYYYYY